MAEHTDTPTPIREFIEATNAGDSERFVAAFTQDAYLNDWGREFHGHRGVATWDRTDNIGKKSRFQLHSVRAGGSPGEFRADITVTGDGYNGRGTMAFTLNGDLISRLVIG
jgi:hypothetical protein